MILMTANQSREFPRVNFVAFLAAALLLISLFLEWWGIDTSGTLTESFRWSLWSGPNTITINGDVSAQTLTTYGSVVGAIVIISAILVLVGTVPNLSRLLIGGAVLAIIAPIVYVIVVNNAVSSACNGAANCFRGPFGTQTFSVGIFSFTVNWGFQPGFYIEIVGAILAIIAIAFQRTFIQLKSSGTGLPGASAPPP